MRTIERDDDLVAAAQGGDKEAFAALFTRHRPLLVALCRRTLTDPVMSEDAVQEAAITALLSLDRLRSADRFGSWLGGIGLNICRRMLRERARDSWSWEAMQGGRRVPETPDPEPGPEALAEAADLAERTRNAIAILPPGQRAAVVHFYLSGLTHAETADLLGISVGAVKTRLHKARHTLERRLSKSDSEREHEMDERLTRRTLAKTAAALSGSATLGHGATAHAEANVERETTTMVAMRVIDVRRRQPDQGLPASHVVVLEEIGGMRRLPIWVRESEGAAIAIHLEGAEVPRPLTGTFAAGLLAAAGGRLTEIRIDRLVDNVFYATAVVEGASGTVTVDARPSDAINLALLTGTSIRVDSAILDQGRMIAETLDEITEGSAEIVADAIR